MSLCIAEECLCIQTPCGRNNQKPVWAECRLLVHRKLLSSTSLWTLNEKKKWQKVLQPHVEKRSCQLQTSQTSHLSAQRSEWNQRLADDRRRLERGKDLVSSRRQWFNTGSDRGLSEVAEGAAVHFQTHICTQSFPCWQCEFYLTVSFCKLNVLFPFQVV